ncbi:MULTISPECIES: hypothetical protein [Bacillus]|uniref:Uncharacterized protein n=1 Tax=Bacillus glycinifermentans TaxID=1664069 RepID=A0AAJ4D3P7_9BACI|nr:MULTISPECIES: hypothetical protein [Bacillus]KKB73250.1 hypothetical protein TH62_13320 [Bacillus sp. TH008]MDU0073676.1 hypothetical protein [Bacillus sp. IG6]MED8021548.1 hypothetical protein [Bacillus glycinifermentans]QAT66658.1 hypothetical protein EQZ20_18445 [Bacillus glycinifermentans]WKB76411.1 hypothetical protein QYM22_18850 [Bacillus glycinifermentans]
MDKLQEKLGQDFVVQNQNLHTENKIRVYKKVGNDVSQEVFVELQNNHENKIYNLILNQRGNEFNKEQFIDREEAICALGIYAVSVLSDRVRDTETQNKILEIEDNDFDFLKNLLNLKVGESYFSILKEKRIAINLEQSKDDLYNICYINPDLQKIDLVKDREAPSAFLVLYNFTQKLKEFTSILNEWKKSTNISLHSEEKIRRLFLGK